MKRWLCLLLLALTGGGLSLVAQDGFQITKARRLVQTSTAAPVLEAGNPFRFSVRYTDFPLPGLPVVLRPPTGSTKVVPAVQGDLDFSATAATAAALNATYGSGRYTVELDLFGMPANATAQLLGDAYPVAPQLGNFTAAQALPAGAGLLLQFNPFTGGNAEDLIHYRVRSAGGQTVLDEFQDGTSTEFLIDADTLAGGQTYTLEVTYSKLSSPADPEELLGAEGRWETTTTLSLKTTGSGGGTDKIPPTLVLAVPGNLTQLTNQRLAILFTFSEAMDIARNPVQWNAVSSTGPLTLDPAKFQYVWNAEGTILACLYDQLGGGWPAGASVVWQLPGGNGGFRDLAANALVAAQGQFQVTTGTDPNDCERQGPVETAGFGILKFTRHQQTSTAAPGPHPQFTAGFQAFSQIPQSPGPAAVEFPASPAPLPHQVKFLSGVGSTTLFQQSFPGQVQLEAAYPAGGYDFQLRNTQDPNSILAHVVLTFPANAYPPVPRIANFTAAQTINPDADFTLTWDAFAGAAAGTDSLSLEISDPDGNLIFRAPDVCEARTLAVTATSVVLPRGLLASGKVYTADLSFYRLNQKDQAMPGTSAKGVTASFRSTEILLKTTGGTRVSRPLLKSIHLTAGGGLDLEVEAPVGRSFVLEQAGTLTGVFSPVLTTNPPSATFLLTLPVAEGAFFRGRTD